MISKIYHGRFHKVGLRYLEINENVQRVARFSDKVVIIFRDDCEKMVDDLMAKYRYVESVKDLEKVR